MPPKLYFNDMIWILRGIDSRIAGGSIAKMIKVLSNYPLKTSRLELISRNLNKKDVKKLAEEFI